MYLFECVRKFDHRIERRAPIYCRNTPGAVALVLWLFLAGQTGWQAFAVSRFYTGTTLSGLVRILHQRLGYHMTKVTYIFYCGYIFLIDIPIHIGIYNQSTDTTIILV